MISDSSIKGRLAEAIVEEMFLNMGFQVFRYGMENSIPGFGSRVLPRTGEIADKIRKMPDFVIVKNEKTHFIEVKYRSSGEFDFNQEYKDGYPYPGAYLVLVTPKYIKAQKAEKLQNGKSFIWLSQCKDFETDKDIILQYLEFVKKFFANC
jgi:hypothetical protein